MYFISKPIHFSKEKLPRPLICKSQVSPGQTLKRRRYQSMSNPSFFLTGRDLGLTKPESYYPMKQLLAKL
jgi:hypothetical protein